MPAGRANTLAELSAPIARLLETERRAVLSTRSPDGTLHSVPVVFAVVDDEIISPIDHKPKSGVVLRRVRNLERDDRATLLIDRWDEDWTQLAWLMVRGSAQVDEEYPESLGRALNARYPQYARDERHDALIRLRATHLLWWSWT